MPSPIGNDWDVTRHYYRTAPMLQVKPSFGSQLAVRFRHSIEMNT